AADTGVSLKVKPVLPMVMRGVPATREKGIYIFSDAVREAHELGMTFGKMADPIGDPVRRCYSIYPWACEQNRGNDLLSQFLKAAFVDGVNTNNDRGLQRVVEHAGLDWNQAKSRIGESGWEALLEANRKEMYGFGCWGVPSFRLLDANGEQVLALWGQDRLWLFAREIKRLLAGEAV
ncbi:MAG: DsbA family protein, partial [Pseudomonadales bacterium]